MRWPAFTAGLLPSLPAIASSVGCDYRDECIGISAPLWAVVAFATISAFLAWIEHSGRPKTVRDSLPPIAFGLGTGSVVLALIKLIG